MPGQPTRCGAACSWPQVVGGDPTIVTPLCWPPACLACIDRSVFTFYNNEFVPGALCASNACARGAAARCNVRTAAPVPCSRGEE